MVTLNHTATKDSSANSQTIVKSQTGNLRMPPVAIAVNMFKITNVLKALVFEQPYLLSFSYSFAHVVSLKTHRSKYWKGEISELPVQS